MAIDGVKIIDSDDAYDIYNDIVGRYKDGIDVGPRKIEYHIACTRTLQTTEPTMDDFVNSVIAYKKMNSEFLLETDCWFNHKDLGELLPYLKKIGRIKLKPYCLGVLSTANTLEQFYDDITNGSEIWSFKIIEISEMMEGVLEN